jgi:hypothetical protein
LNRRTLIGVLEVNVLCAGEGKQDVFDRVESNFSGVELREIASSPGEQAFLSRCAADRACPPAVGCVP